MCLRTINLLNKTNCYESSKINLNHFCGGCFIKTISLANQILVVIKRTLVRSPFGCHIKSLNIRMSEKHFIIIVHIFFSYRTTVGIVPPEHDSICYLLSILLPFARVFFYLTPKWFDVVCMTSGNMIHEMD